MNIFIKRSKRASLFAQFLLLLILGAVFRKPLTQAYDRLVERGYIKPESLPWQSG